MDSRGPTTTVRAGAPTAVVGTSRLAQMQMRFQQRQQQERDQRKIEQIATRTTSTTGTVAIASSNGGRTATTTTSTTTSGSAVSTTVELSERLNATSLSSTLGAGKVRQMFDERRHRVAGIDKSYPLQPIQTTSTVPVAHGNHSVNGNSSNNGTNGNEGGAASLARGMTKTGLNNKPRVPPISASSRTRLMQQQAQARGTTNLRQDSLVGMQTIRANNVGDALESSGGGYDDNDNFLELEKFPDTAPFDEDTLDTADRINVLNGNGVVAKLGKSHASTTKPLPSNTAQKASKKSPVTSSNSMPARSPNGSAKSGVATPRSTVPSAKSNGPSRTVTQPSPSSSAGSVRRPSTVSSMLANEPVPDGLIRCDICSRNFATDRIEKHRQICQKTKSKKRKVFDITKHRVQGTDAESFVLKGKKSSTGPGGAVASRKQSSQLSTVNNSVSAAAAAGSKQSNWRKKHEEFIATIRAAKEMKAHLARGGKLSDLPPPPPSENPDYIQCPHCSRRFNQTAAERHIPKCDTMLHNKPKPKPKATSTIRRY
ncbi:zinc finger C2HC domain-containing protein 1C [Anopheles maculipalpis]|uniref:zinc finger C2HC domain-containing protein 1C n=1 Tax=Anopheles maculipalpis TaxID=1496333 RepID=UPI002158D8A7|nr:zinc finger C2HC domain-containing protein 1C [Anopheles maculipalpis]